MNNKQMKKEKRGDLAIKFNNFINKHFATIVCLVVVCIMVAGIANATGGGTGSGTGGAGAGTGGAGAGTGGASDQLWMKITNLVETWVTRLGGVVMFVGGVMFALGWKSDDAEQKSRGISTIIAGAIVIAIAALTSTFFA